MTDEQWNEQWNLENGARFNQLVCNYPITDDELLKMCKVLCEFVALTRVTDIDDYFFLDKDHTIPRLPFMLNSFDDIIKSKNNKGE